ncbi:hypothetical protein KTH_57270 [Thermosporothrix hazakensis]|nr:hypothetical protein KTH_57270 [Thermosporothrix hazakensis]
MYVIYTDCTRCYTKVQGDPFFLSGKWEEIWYADEYAGVERIHKIKDEICLTLTRCHTLQYQ